MQPLRYVRNILSSQDVLNQEKSYNLLIPGIDHYGIRSFIVFQEWEHNQYMIIAKATPTMAVSAAVPIISTPTSINSQQHDRNKQH